MSKFIIKPQPGSILGSLRSIGYNLKTALSDIIDNSIAAEAKRIEIVNNDLSKNVDQLEWMAIIDDGLGMTLEEMVMALTLGGEGIERERDSNDLGRFGLGLKTASFSQCRKLTLISKKENGDINSLAFDLDYIIKNGWEVYSLDNPDFLIEEVKSRLEKKDIFENKSWTLVYWEKLDKVQIASVASFYDELSKVRNHFELIYHKFENIVNIRLNGTIVNYWNPYETAVSSQKKYFNYNYGKDTYTLKGHVLKHSSEFQNKGEYKNQSKIGTFNQNQGFFIYRNKRLIYRGSWLGLFTKEHHYILGRVEINLSNRLESDLAWGVNISKSSVSIPKFAESDIRAECNRIRSEANDTDTGKYGYDTSSHVLNAKDFGLAQSRERIFFIGVRKDLSKKHDINASEIFDEIIKLKKDPLKLKDIIYDLPQIKANPKPNNYKEELEISFSKMKVCFGKNISDEPYEDLLSKKSCSKYLSSINTYKGKLITPKYLFNHKSRYNNERDLFIYKNLVAGKYLNDPVNKKALSKVTYGVVIDKNGNKKVKGFGDKYFKLNPESVSKTIIAHLETDGNSYVHPGAYPRSITPREAARIQSFPDWYFFTGNTRNQFKQIGNAVPPLLGGVFAEQFKNVLDRISQNEK